MRAALRIARFIGCGVLIAVGSAGALLFGLMVILEDETGVRITAAVLTAIAVAMVFGGVRWWPRREPGETVPDAPPPPSEASRQAFERLARGETIVLRPRRWLWAVLLAFVAAFTVAFVLWFIDTPHVVPAALALFFGAIAVLCVLQFFPRWAHLRIAPDGLVLRHTMRTTRWEWNDIEHFVPYEIHHQYSSTKLVGFDRRDLTPARQSFFQTLARGMTGVDGSLPDTYGMRHEELAELLNVARDRYATEHGPSPSLLADLELQREADAVRRDRLPVVTVALATTCIAAFVMEVSSYGLFPSTPELREAGGASRDALSDGAWWTLLSANVLHVNPIHLFLNLVGFAIIGVLLERELGWRRFGLLCLVGGLASMSLGVLLQLGAGVVGLSGVVYAVAAYAVVRDTHRTRALGVVAWAMVPIGVIYTFLAPGVSIGAHLGGLVAGFALGYVFERGLGRRRVAAVAR